MPVRVWPLVPQRNQGFTGYTVKFFSFSTILFFVCAQCVPTFISVLQAIAQALGKELVVCIA